MSRGREAMVGVVIVVAVTVAVLGTLWMQGRTFGPVRTAEVLTESVGQLGQGNAVVYRGVRIGRVAVIEVLPDGSGVRISLVLEEGITLPRDPAVVLGPESLFGDWQAEIVSRTTYPNFPFYEVGEGATVEPGSDGAEPAPLLGGYALPELSRLTRSAEQIAANIQSLSGRLELAFNEETASNLSSAVENVEAMTQDLRAFVVSQTEVGSAITASADSALSEIADAAGAARRSFESLEGIIDGAALDTMMADVRIAATGIREVSEQLADSTSGVAVTLARVDSAFARIDRIVGRIESGEGSFGRLLGDSTLVVRAEDVLGQLELLLEDLRENPRRYVRLSIF